MRACLLFVCLVGWLIVCLFVRSFICLFVCGVVWSRVVCLFARMFFLCVRVRVCFGSFCLCVSGAMMV